MSIKTIKETLKMIAETSDRRYFYIRKGRGDFRLLARITDIESIFADVPGVDSFDFEFFIEWLTDGYDIFAYEPFSDGEIDAYNVISPEALVELIENA